MNVRHALMIVGRAGMGKSNVIKTSNKYNYYLSTVEDYKDVILEEVFDILMKEGK